jgi:hypothetical protein
VGEVLAAAPLVQTPENRSQLLDWALGRSTGTTDWTLGNRDDHGVHDWRKTPTESEGVGSYWAFATGRRVDQANLLLQQIVATPETRYVLLPNQYIGAWRVGFMAEWIAREYLARRGSAPFGREQVDEADFPLLGYIPRQLKIEGSMIPRVFLRVEEQILMLTKRARGSVVNSLRTSSSSCRFPISILSAIASSRPASTAPRRRIIAA